jgi:hypothetical protein
MDWLLGLPMTVSGFDHVQVHVDHLSGKVHAVPTRSTDTAADAARIILEMALRSGDGVPDVLMVDHDPKFTSALFREFTRRLGSSLLVCSAYHKKTKARAERVNGMIGNTLRAFANGDKKTTGTYGCLMLSSPSSMLPPPWLAISPSSSSIGASIRACLSPFLTLARLPKHRRSRANASSQPARSLRRPQPLDSRLQAPSPLLATRA